MKRRQRQARFPTLRQLNGCPTVEQSSAAAAAARLSFVSFEFLAFVSVSATVSAPTPCSGTAAQPAAAVYYMCVCVRCIGSGK